MTTNHIFCDESHVDTHAFRVQGGIWVPDTALRAVRAEFKALRSKHPLFRGEFKWTYVSGREPKSAYIDLMELFFGSAVAPMLSFKALVVRRADDASQRANKTGQDVGFFKAYYTLLYYRLWHGTDNHVRIDERCSPREDPAEDLARCLNTAAARDLEQPFRVVSCRLVRSHDEDLLQLADVFCGLVGWAWNGMKSTCEAKARFDAHVAQRLGCHSLYGYRTGPSAQKFNVWLYTPKKK